MNLGQIDLNLLVAFERVLALGSVTRAAKELGITQPAMSRTPSGAQGTRRSLFVKVGRTLVATDARRRSGPLTEALRAAGRVLEPPRCSTEDGDGNVHARARRGSAGRVRRHDRHDIWSRPGHRRARPTARLPDLRGPPAAARSTWPSVRISGAPGPKIHSQRAGQKKLYTRSFVVARSSDTRGLYARTVRRRLARDHRQTDRDARSSTTCSKRSATARHVAATVTSFPIAASARRRHRSRRDAPRGRRPDERARAHGAHAPVRDPATSGAALWHPRRTPDAPPVLAHAGARRGARACSDVVKKKRAGVIVHHAGAPPVVLARERSAVVRRCCRTLCRSR